MSLYSSVVIRTYRDSLVLQPDIQGYADHGKSGGHVGWLKSSDRGHLSQQLPNIFKNKDYSCKPEGPTDS